MSRADDTDFASQRFPQRQARDVSHAYAIEHYKPEHHVPWRPIVFTLAAALIVWLLYRSI
jgi:hypothetical protein